MIRFDRMGRVHRRRQRTATAELPTVEPLDAVMIQYTSGTTGFPKGALLHHRGLVNNGAHTLERIGVRDGAVSITMMPLFHTGGCAMCVLGAIVDSNDTGAGRSVRRGTRARADRDLSLRSCQHRADDARRDCRSSPTSRPPTSPP